MNRAYFHIHHTIGIQPYKTTCHKKSHSERAALYYNDKNQQLYKQQPA